MSGKWWSVIQGQQLRPHSLWVWLVSKWNWSGGRRVRGQMSSILETYEDMIGIRQVKDAQSQVLQAELRFGEAQEGRRAAQLELNGLEVRLREVRYDLEKTPRGEQHYLDLVKREMELIREERVLRDAFLRQEKEERDLFGGLSSALRASHEKERAQSEKTKYWSLTGSIVGTLVGIIGATITSTIRMNQLKSLVVDTAGAGLETEGRIQELLAQLDSAIHHPAPPPPPTPNPQIHMDRLMADATLQLRKDILLSTALLGGLLLLATLLSRAS